MKKKFIGEKLKLARLYRGMTVEELANEINLKKQSVSQYETGKIVPEFDKILSLSKALNFPYGYFTNELEISANDGSTYFRALLKTSKKYRVSQIIKINHLSYIYKILSEYVNFPSLKIPTGEGTGSIEDTADNLRNFWGLGNNPIYNLVRVLEKNGIVVTTFETPSDEIDAFSHYAKINEQELFFVALSSNKDRACRKHFDIAHELGHILLHEWSEDVEALTREEFKQREQEANEFASAFLLPKDEFIKDVSSFPTNLNYYIQLKKKWHVSISAMIIRSYNLGIITYNQYQYMMRAMQYKGMRKNEPLDDVITTAEPSLLKDAVSILLDEHVFTPTEFMEELTTFGLSMNYDDVEILLNLDKGTLKPHCDESLNINNIVQLKFKDPSQRK